MANGTDALELALKSVGVGQDDGVVLAANAAMYGTTAVFACGGRPVYSDVLDEDLTLDPDAVRTVLDEQTGIRAILVTHLYGRLAQIDALQRLAREYGVALIEDCAQAHGAKGPDGRCAGSYGDASAFSFYPTKNLGALGDAGAVLCRDEMTLSRLRRLRQYGWSAKYDNAILGGRNTRLDEIQAAALRIMLPRLDSWNDARREIAGRYSAEIRNPRIRCPRSPDSSFVAHLYVIRCSQRTALRQHLAAAGISTDIHYPIPDHRQACFEGKFNTLHLPRTDANCSLVMTLPCFPEMGSEEVSRVVEACNRF